MLYEVKKSVIAGLGLFATRDLRVGDCIGVIETRNVRKKDDPNYIITSLDGSEKTVMCDLKYINHSTKPNVAYFEDGTVEVIAAVKKGDELTHYYSKEFQEWVEEQQREKQAS